MPATHEPLFLRVTTPDDLFPEKVASALSRMPDDEKRWPAHVFSELCKEFPFMTQYDLEVVLDRMDPEAGAGLGYVQVQNKTVSRPQDSAQYAGNVLRVPIVIQDRRLQKFYIFEAGGAAYPLTEARIQQAMLNPTVFDTDATRIPSSPSLLDQLYPPNQQRTGFGRVAEPAAMGLSKLSSAKIAVLPPSLQNLDHIPRRQGPLPAPPPVPADLGPRQSPTAAFNQNAQHFSGPQPAPGAPAGSTFVHTRPASVVAEHVPGDETIAAARRHAAVRDAHDARVQAHRGGVHAESPTVVNRPAPAPVASPAAPHPAPVPAAPAPHPAAPHAVPAPGTAVAAAEHAAPAAAGGLARHLTGRNLAIGGGALAVGGLGAYMLHRHNQNRAQAPVQKAASLRDFLEKDATYTPNPAPDVVTAALSPVLHALLALHQVYYFGHWTSQGEASYSDHELFTRLYEAAQEDFDAVAERIIGHGGNQAVDPGSMFSEAGARSAAHMQEAQSLFAAALAAEQELQVALQGAYDTLDQNGGMSLGIDDLLMSIASKHESHQYLLKQRCPECAEVAAPVQEPLPQEQVAPVEQASAPSQEVQQAPAQPVSQNAAAPKVASIAAFFAKSAETSPRVAAAAAKHQAERAEWRKKNPPSPGSPAVTGDD